MPTLQQLRYLVAVAEHGSINGAAASMYVSQSNLSVAMRDLERELGITAFTRSNKGVALTNDGTELLSYARQVVEQADMLEARYARGNADAVRLAVSSQHYYFSLKAFINVAEACASEKYDFVLRECATGQIIEDVSTFRADIGVLYLDDFNRRVLGKALRDAGTSFTPLFETPVHVFVSETHPLAKKTLIRLEDLDPYPRYSFEQGKTNSFYYSEEPFGYLPHARNIRFSDRGTLTNLLTSFNGYTISTGVLSSEMHSGIVSIPLDVDQKMQVGYIMHTERTPSELLERYIQELRREIDANPMVQAVSA